VDRLQKSRLNRRIELYHLARRISEGFAHRVSMVPLTRDEARDVKPFYLLGMLTAHQLLIDREGFFRGVLERLQHRLTALGSKRYVEPDGAEYWILKPNRKLGEAIVL
jgi:hypothetical protein